MSLALFVILMIAYGMTRFHVTTVAQCRILIISASISYRE